MFEQRFGDPVVVCLLLLASPCFPVVCCADFVPAVAVTLPAVVFVPTGPLLLLNYLLLLPKEKHGVWNKIP